MRKHLFVCDGCDITLESNSNQLPPGWKTVEVLTTDRAQCSLKSSYELCDECSERLHPVNWIRPGQKLEVVK